jgi:alpha-L-fucosidase
MVTSRIQHDPPQGAQRLSIDMLRAWESLGYGMFVHFGMSTFDGDELSRGDKPSSLYAPDRLDVDQWVQVARDAGMKYAVLTAKHVAGHCLWPSKLTDYHVGTSGNTTDVIERFVAACEKHRLMAGFYYCSWDNHHTFGSITPSDTAFHSAFTTSAYREFQLKQVEELLTQYGPWGEVWIDIPGVLGADGRRVQYNQIARLAPNAVIMMNSGFGDGSVLKYDYAWPADLMAIERHLPHSERGYNPWHKIAETNASARDYYVPGEVCDPIGYMWFGVEDDAPRSDGELLGMRLICRARHANLLLNVPPDRHGLIPPEHVDALTRLRKNLERLGA